ncbi:MAG: Lrp/AsnC family transcriptional regulator [Betaproteobacteria bacterium]|jgi:Lrp/AsnC family transcriptional regulator|nr:Lrp/AsnC family transcriptional regulator [Betaproteobacteria bacterium]
MDKFDREILRQLQRDADLPMARIAEAIGISPAACWRRLQRLQEAGVVRGKVALLDDAKLNAGVTVFVSIRTSDHSASWVKAFSTALDDIEEIVEIYRMSGEVDYLLKIKVPDIKAYDAIYRKIIERMNFLDVSSSFAMEQIKSTTALPLSYLELE